VVVYGSGGHGKVVADAVLATPGWELVGFLDDRAQAGTRLLGCEVLGGGDLLADLAAQETSVALGVGANAARQQVFERCVAAGIAVVTVVHPSATVSPSATLGPGVVVLAQAAVNPDAALGDGALVNTSAVVEHDCRIGAFAHLSPRAALGGAAQVGARAHLGLGAVVLPGISVGADSVVGAGAVVVRDLPSGITAVGVPARIRSERP
jgi:sugar O-acyltransferase (sialic acid O-acetyltransferase NeuD family)